jgi:hypothetical protein
MRWRGHAAPLSTPHVHAARGAPHGVPSAEGEVASLCCPERSGGATLHSYEMLPPAPRARPPPPPLVLFAHPCDVPPTCTAIVPQVTKEEYGQYGGPALGERLAAQLRRERGLNPFVIPVGGSSSMGVWG